MFSSKKFLGYLIVIAFIWLWLQPNFGWVTYDPLIYNLREPKQSPVTKPQVINHKKQFRINPIATFDLEGRVLNSHRYFFGTEAELVPVDLALGWGAMANYRVVKELHIGQKFRFYFYNFTGAPPIPRQEIVRSSANMHLIPANKKVEKAIKQARRGHVIHLKGYLVNIHGPNGWSWTTSTTRNDEGSGACEVIYVKEFTIKPHPEWWERFI